TSPRFTINVTLANRLPLHPQINDIVGNFTSLNLLAIDSVELHTFEDRAKRIQKQLWSDLDHRYYSGVRVLRDLARLRGMVGRALMPVVFTSTLVQQFPAQARPLFSGQEVAYGVSQRPQVWLNNQVSEQAESLVLVWDAIEELFPPDLLDTMFEAYRQLLQALASGEEAWQEPLQTFVPSTSLPQQTQDTPYQGQSRENAQMAGEQMQQDTAFAHPTNELERQIAEIYQELLNVEQISIYSNFFASGGNSLLVVRLKARLYETFRRHIDIRSLFSSATVADLARIVEQRLAERQEERP
ncbi:MAG TPA: phosphopantetheine-binding protein, partial [Ktedonobacteraceae bacterium]|nr:phosphopantetheine-binding protein [Ktedonobacteraceae bacterium]